MDYNNLTFTNQCLLFHRTVVIDFLEFWREGCNDGYPFSLPALFEDTQLQYFLSKKIVDNYELDSRIILPTKEKYNT